MAHKVLVDGTAYEISGGRTLVNGTGYSIDKGKTLVGGTVYEVGFAPSEVTVTITKTSAGSNCGVTIDGITYGGKGSTVSTTLAVPIGTVIYCTAFINDNDTQGYVSVNGIQVASGGVRNYAYTVKENISISMSGNKDGGVVEITEIPEGHALVQITGTGNSSACYVDINGTKYYSANAIAIPVGTVIYCYAISPEKDSDYYGVIKCNGTTVATATNETPREKYYAEYNYTVNGDVTIKLSGSSAYGNITITEQ